MKALVDAYVAELKKHLAEIGERWREEHYQKPLHRRTDKPGVAVYPITEDADEMTSGFDQLTTLLAVEYWENANREAETLLRDQPAAAQWLELFGRFRKAVYSIPELPAHKAWDIRYRGSDFGVDDEAIARVFRLRVRFLLTSPEFP